MNKKNIGDYALETAGEMTPSQVMKILANDSLARVSFLLWYSSMNLNGLING